VRVVVDLATEKEKGFLPSGAGKQFTPAALIFLKKSPVLPSYDLGHLCAIQRRIVGDVFDWPGSCGPATGTPGPRRRRRSSVS
jgi:hypothetical protein